jgi:WD40 repeat protein
MSRPVASGLLTALALTAALLGRAPAGESRAVRDLLGIWKDADRDAPYVEYWRIRHDKNVWSVECVYKKGTKYVGSFHGENIKFARGTLTFTRVFDRKPVAAWPDGAVVTAKVAGKEIAYTWERAGQRGTGTLVRTKAKVTAFANDPAEKEPVKKDPVVKDPVKADPVVKAPERKIPSPGGAAAMALTRGGLLVVVGFDEKVLVWDLGADRQQKTLKLSHDGLGVAAVSPDGKLAATAGADRRIKLWDLETGKEKAVLGGHQHLITALAFSPDGKRLASADTPPPAAAVKRAAVKVWAVATGREVFAAEEEARALAFSPDGHLLAAGCYRATPQRTFHLVKLWSDEGKSLGEMHGHTGLVMSLAFSPDGRLLASGGEDRNVVVWKLATREPRHTLAGPGGAVFALAFAPGGEWLAGGGSQGLAKFWNADTGRSLGSVKVHPDTCQRLLFTPNGQAVIAGSRSSNDLSVTAAPVRK